MTLLISCVAPQQVFVTETNSRDWSRDQPAVVRFDNRDTVSLRSVNVVVRCGSDFRYDRLGLILTTVTPDGYRWTDTLTVPVAKPESRAGYYRDGVRAYRDNVLLSQPGVYLFSFEPLMPGGTVDGIAAVGIEVCP